MSMFKPSILTLALTAAGLNSFVAYAAEEDQKAKNDNVEVIEVKGFRGSVVESINTKRFTPEVVESISAEDIGKLPDSSIAESIARLPGLQVRMSREAPTANDEKAMPVQKRVVCKVQSTLFSSGIWQFPSQMHCRSQLARLTGKDGSHFDPGIC